MYKFDQRLTPEMMDGIEQGLMALGARKFLFVMRAQDQERPGSIRSIRRNGWSGSCPISCLPRSSCNGIRSWSRRTITSVPRSAQGRQVIRVDTTILQGLQQIFREHLSAPQLELHPDMEVGVLDGWDSFANVEILLACEEKWGLRFGAAEIDQIRSVGDLARTIEARLG